MGRNVVQGIIPTLPLESHYARTCGGEPKTVCRNPCSAIEFLWIDYAAVPLLDFFPHLRSTACTFNLPCHRLSAMPPIARPRRIVGVSLKMYFDLTSTLSYVRGVLQLDGDAWNANVDLFVIPDFVSLTESQRILEPSSVMLGAQDTHWEDKGAFTGEVSPAVLRQAGVRIVEIGHAERRALFGETDKSVAKKAGAAARNGLIPLVCIGEKTHHSIASAAVGAAIQECKPQVTSVLAAVPDDQEVILAYEPVWAIGAKEPADPDHVVNVTKELRKFASGRSGVTRIVYGGSAGPGTYAKIAEGVDGLFLGRFAHDIQNLKKVIEEVGGA